MSEQVMAVYSRYLTEFGALSPVKLGGKAKKAELPSAEDVARFLVAVEGCQRSTKRVQTLMLLASKLDRSEGAKFGQIS